MPELEGELRLAERPGRGDLGHVTFAAEEEARLVALGAVSDLLEPQEDTGVAHAGGGGSAAANAVVRRMN